MNHIAVIGAGQLGCRHFQALALLDGPVHLQIMDINKDALTKANFLFRQIEASTSTKAVDYKESISGLANEIDIAIVATNADVRRAVVEELLQKKQVKYLILEKVLFQKIDDYFIIGELLKAKGVKAWVNCPRRIWPVYQTLKSKFEDAKSLEYHFSGGNWGLGCNAIHFIDHVAFLTGESDFTIWGDRLEPDVLPSKRQGFVEFTGMLHGETARKSSFSLTCYPEPAPDLTVITSEKIRAILRQSEKKAWISEREQGWEWQEIQFDVPYQSQLTNIVVKQILDTDECGLTGYSESAKLHLPMLQAFLDHLKRSSNYRDESESKLCPIT